MRPLSATSRPSEVFEWLARERRGVLSCGSVGLLGVQAENEWVADMGIEQTRYGVGSFCRMLLCGHRETV